MQKIREKYPNVQAEVVTIINYFFGESITVSGLITGKDLMEQLEGRDLASACCFRAICYVQEKTSFSTM